MGKFLVLAIDSAHFEVHWNDPLKISSWMWNESLFIYNNKAVERKVIKLTTWLNDQKEGESRSIGTKNRPLKDCEKIC